MLVVDDSVVIRRLVTALLDADPEITVIGTAASGSIALEKLRQLAPDCVTMDVEMPGLDGIQTVRELRKTHPRLPVVMFSTLTERSASATLDALAAGASDYVCKPANVGSLPKAIESVRAQLIPKIKALCPVARGPRVGGVPVGRGPAPVPAARPYVAPPRPGQRPAPVTTPVGGVPAARTSAPASRLELLAIGSSTGGPDALGSLLPLLPAGLPVPVVITQHMPPVFTRLFAQRLDGKCALRVKEAEEGDLVVAGTILIAPGERHLELQRRGSGIVAHLSEAPAENYCRPAVDVMFRSASGLYGAGVLAAVLTGMGADGARGAEVVRRAGGEVVVQDEASSVVWGMPGAVFAAGQADRVLPLDRIAADLISALSRGRSSRLVAASP